VVLAQLAVVVCLFTARRAVWLSGHMHYPAAVRPVLAGRAREQALARHLGNAIHTGRLCSYQPEETVSWQT
jgi:hypothetical protein